MKQQAARAGAQAGGGATIGPGLAVLLYHWLAFPLTQTEMAALLAMCIGLVAWIGRVIDRMLTAKYGEAERAVELVRRATLDAKAKRS